jgi:protein-S-isoprenylcysteine O-methyltransferase Ste14
MAIAGGALCVAGEALRLWGVAHIGAVSRTRGDEVGALVEGGPFGWSRNPLYVGNLALWAGVGLLAGRAWLAALVVGALALHYRFVIGWEETNLRARLGAPYDAYTARVPRWFGGPGGGGAGDWRAAVRSERSTFVALSAVVAAVLAVGWARGAT